MPDTVDINQDHILIVDDEPDILELLDITLVQMGYLVTSAAMLADAKEAINQTSFSLCLTDMQLPDGNGIELIKYIKQHQPLTPIAMITAFGNVDTATSALKAGAFDFISKPVKLQHIRSLVEAALRANHQSANGETNRTVELLGSTKIIEDLRETISRVARSQAPVFINGESGTGKELVARLIHNNGPRANGPFIAVNCGAIPAELMESEFFGHRKGSFTGASHDKAGLFEAAKGGTLFLDEIADLPLNMQVKLLRAIQEKAVRRIGDNEEKNTDIRLLSATHKDLGVEVDQEKFRQDLFYRINVIQIDVPNLRNRADDIPLLCSHIIKRLSQEWNLSIPKLSNDAISTLKTYNFPGNVRELENILERALTLSDGKSISSLDLQLPTITLAQKAMPAEKVSIDQISSIEDYLEEIEMDLINQALEKTRWNKTKAADLLGISFRQLRYKLKRLNID
ncbi:MAG: two-component system response regulator PilR (NtrC family) [Pseudomonadales bacterium]|jgi:two-component system response regulator PilR (NtrC family)